LDAAKDACNKDSECGAIEKPKIPQNGKKYVLCKGNGLQEKLGSRVMVKFTHIAEPVLDASAPELPTLEEEPLPVLVTTAMPEIERPSLPFLNELLNKVDEVDACTSYSDCSTCLADYDCIWNAETNACGLGADAIPGDGSVFMCPAEPTCADFSDCSTCMAGLDETCLWNANTNACGLGADAIPGDGSVFMCPAERSLPTKFSRGIVDLLARTLDEACTEWVNCMLKCFGDHDNKAEAFNGCQTNTCKKAEMCH